MTRQLPPCPAPGAGVHSWILAEANRCRATGLSEVEAEGMITQRLTRRPSPANEVVTAIRKAYTASNWKPLSQSPAHFQRQPIPITEIKFDFAKLKAMAEKITPPSNWRHWLWERSLKRPEAMNGWSFLSHCYQPGEHVHVFDKMDGFEGYRPIHTITITHPMDCRVPDLISRGGRFGLGIWYLCNPIDKQWHPNPRNENKPSCRSEESVTSFRYAVLESDQASPDLWLGFIAQLPMRVAAINTSGSRSIHCLINVDVANKAEWDHSIAPLKRPLKVLGADPACLSAVRLTRLPQCGRPEKRGFQRLLYLHPDPPLMPLMDLPVTQLRLWALARWQRDCSRWNRNREAFQ